MDKQVHAGCPICGEPVVARNSQIKATGCQVVRDVPGWECSSGWRHLPFRWRPGMYPRHDDAPAHPKVRGAVVCEDPRPRWGLTARPS
jgi:hypothetical protein